MRDATILIVDDEEMLRELLRRSLQNAGYTIYTASDGKAALELFQHRPIDLVMADVRMPGMDGFTLCVELRKQSNVPIIMVTSLNRPEDIAYAYSLGADACIAKPFQLRETMVCIESMLCPALDATDQPFAGGQDTSLGTG